MADDARDPFTAEIIRNALLAIGDEMFVAMQRASMSPIIYEVLDFGVGVTDHHGRLLTQGNGVPLFIGTLDASVQSVLAKFGPAGAIRPGDIYISNDPYSGGGTHLSDVSLIMPIFDGADLVAFVANKAHWSEVGGKNPGSWTTDATDVFQEGMQFPNVKLFDGGIANQPLIEMIRANVRLPDMSLGDMWAGIAALRVGEERVLDLIRKYGREAFFAAIDGLLDYSERTTRAELARLPKGVFAAEDWIDDDGVGNGPFPIRVKVTITADRFVADFTGSHPQVPGPINNTYTGLVSGVRGAFLAITSPAAPNNEGCFRALEVICPEGTLFTATRPAPVSTYWETLLCANDLIWKSLAPHVPERLPAGHLLSTCGTIIAETEPATGQLKILVEPLVGGWGASYRSDGQNGQFCAGDGETFNIPVEVTEATYGLRVERYGFHNEAGGAGTYRGGKGVVLDYRVLADEVFLTAAYGRHRFSPWALAGGEEGSRNYIEVHRQGGAVERYGKVARCRVARDELIRLVTATGGGYGPPAGRARAEILADLRDGYVTPEQARQVYGVTDVAEQAVAE
jgi:N-methylhydantoinase B